MQLAEKWPEMVVKQLTPRVVSFFVQQSIKNTFVGTGCPENQSNFYTKVMENDDQILDSDHEFDNDSEREDEDEQI